MHNAYRSGTADVWYSGSAGDMWVEYKYVPLVPARAPIRVRTLLSARQLQWLKHRHAEGRTVAVILGVSHYAWIYEGMTWESDDVTAVQILKRGLDRKAVADYIRRKTMKP